MRDGSHLSVFVLVLVAFALDKVVLGREWRSATAINCVLLLSQPSSTMLAISLSANAGCINIGSADNGGNDDDETDMMLMAMAIDSTEMFFFSMSIRGKNVRRGQSSAEFGKPGSLLTGEGKRY
jgi:hypothetical protein